MTWDYDTEGNSLVKTCTACKLVKPRDSFPFDKHKSDGLKPHCRLCHASKNQDRRDADPHWHPTVQENYRARQYGLDGRVSPSERRELFENAGYACVKCSSEDYLEMDHIIALNVGGMHEISNCQVLCKSCNSAKGDK